MEKPEITIASGEHHEETISQSNQDQVAEEAKGGDLNDMPPGYYRNWRFIGSVAAVAFLAQGSYLGAYKSLNPRTNHTSHTS